MPLPSYKTIFIGNSGVGKSSIVRYLFSKYFSLYTDPTIGVAYYRHTHTLLSPDQTITSVVFEIWDTAGQERYFSILPIYFRGANIIILVYDATDFSSFKAIVDSWLPYSRSHFVDPTQLKYVLLENKVDLQRTRDLTPLGQQLAQQEDLLFWQTSAKDGIGIIELFDFLSQHPPSFSRVPVNIIEKSPPLSTIAEEKIKKCLACHT